MKPIGYRSNSLAPALAAVLLVAVGIASPVLAAEANENSRISEEAKDLAPIAEPWQIAGIRAGFGDERAPIVEGSPAVQREAAKLCAMHEWGPALEAREVAVLLDSKDLSVRLAAIRALGQMGKVGAPFAAKIAAVAVHGTNGDQTNVEAMLALTEMEKANAAVESQIVTLATRLGDESFIPELLKDLGPGADRTAEAFAELLRSESTRARQNAARALGAMGPAGRPYLPALQKLLGDQDSNVRSSAADAFGALGADGLAYADQVAALLEDQNGHVRRDAADALGQMGVGAAPFAEKLARRIEDGNEDDLEVKEFAAKSLVRFGEPGEAFLRKLNYSPAFMSPLERPGAAIPRTIAVLLVSNDRQARGQAKAALYGKRSDRRFAEELTVLLQDENPNVRAGAAEALGDLGNPDRALGRKVAELLGDRLELVRDAALDAMGRLDGMNAQQTRDVTQLLGDAREAAQLFGDESRPRRALAICALGRLGDAGRELTRVVAPYLTDDDATVRAAAAVALDGWGNAGADLDLQAAFLDAASSVSRKELSPLRAHLRLWSGGDASLQRLVTWLGKPDASPLPKDGLASEEARATLKLFSRFWDHTVGRKALRLELAGRIAQIAKDGVQQSDVEAVRLLSDLAAKMKDDASCADTYHALEEALRKP
ncbi:MAG TPA: HEAT repeat domain-containing protein [Chthoniobacteraceae bacterium]|jgi:HEAT repeat protein